MAEMHIDAYFDKPLDPNRLVDKIRELLGGSSRQEATEGD
jgi:DNA-binding response OmpR family regulator